jgi:hypothetical protein
VTRFGGCYIVVVRFAGREVGLGEVVLLLHLLLGVLLLLLLKLHRVELGGETEHAAFCAARPAHAHAHTRSPRRFFGNHHLVFGAVGVANRVLGDGAHLTGYPAREDLAALLLAETRAVEIAFDDEGDDVDNKLVFV